MKENLGLQLSIIVPVYNVEEYIRPCIESIFRQDLDEDTFEVIIVNDGTEDRSMEVIQDIIEQHKNIIILNQENQGLSIARNNGITMAKGEYIFMPDSDDLLIEHSLKPLLEKAIESKADLVVADFLTMTNEEIHNFGSIQQNKFIYSEKTGEQLFLEDLSPYECFVWRTIYKRDYLIKANLSFYPGIRFQDIPFTHECYLKAKKCLRVFWILNIYRKWTGASTGTFTLEKAKDFCVAIAKTWELTNLNLNNAEEIKLHENIWTSFSVMICNTCHMLQNDSERIELIDFLRTLINDLHFRNGIKQKVISYMYRNMPHVYIRLRYLYGLVFEDILLPFYNQQLRRLSIK